MPSNRFIFYCSLLLLPSIFPSIRVFSKESVLHIRWPKYWSFSISPSNEYSGLTSFRMDWSDLLAAQGMLKSLLQHHSSKACWAVLKACWGSRYSSLDPSSLCAGPFEALARLSGACSATSHAPVSEVCSHLLPLARRADFRAGTTCHPALKLPLPHSLLRSLSIGSTACFHDS